MWEVSDENVRYYSILGGVKKPNSDYYKAILPLLLKKVNEDYNTDFTHDNLPANVELFLAKAAAYYSANSGLKGRKMGSVSYSYDFKELGDEINNLLRGYRKAKYHVFRSYR